MSRQLVLNIDSDGVVVDFNAGIRKLGFAIPDETQWDLGYGRAQFEDMFEEAVMLGVFAIAPPVEEAVEAIHLLHDAGHRIRIVTSKLFNANSVKSEYLTYVARATTLDWYHKYGLSEKVEIAFVGNTKQGYAADLIVDDKPTLEWAQDYPAANLLFNRPWNHGDSLPVRDWRYNLKRAKGWADVLEVVEQMGGGILLDKEVAV